MNKIRKLNNKEFKNRLFLFAKYLLGWPLSLISLIFVIKIIYSGNNSLFRIKSVNIPLLGLSIICFCIYFFLRALLWHELIKEKGNKLSFKKTTYFWEISEIKRYIPGNVWSFFSRSSLFTQNNLSTKNIVSSLFNEIVLIVIGCFSLSVFYLINLTDTFYGKYFWGLSAIGTVIIYVFMHKLGKKIILKDNLENIKQTLIPSNNYFTNIKFYLISVSAFLMFGLATYFSAASIFYLNLGFIMQLVSLFVFSLLVGYLSIITPMGLGVRESVMTLGLSRFLSLSSAGIISIFSRIIFIISELIFLALTFLWVNSKAKVISNAETFIKNHKHGIVLGIFIFLYILYFTSASFSKYDNFYTGRFDLGNMDQAVWNTIHGRIFQVTDPNGTNVISRLAFHADFILILISPLYLIWSNPEMLLLLQTLVLGLGAVFIFLISKNILKNKNLSLTFSLIYLLNPSVQYSNLFDFHPVTLGTAFLLGAFYFFKKKNYFVFLIFALLSGFTKEEVWAIIAIFGIAIITRVIYENKFRIKFLNKRKIFEIIFGFIIFISSSFLFYYLIWHAIPAAKGGNHFALAYYSDFGNNATDIGFNIILSPIKTFQIAFGTQKILYLLQLFLPLGFLSILSPLILFFALPDFAVNLLSNNPQLHEIYYQYTAAITPFLFIAAIYSVYLLKQKFGKVFEKLLIIYLFAASLISAYILGPLPGALHPNIDMFTKQLSNQDEIEDFILSIPVRYSISATNNLGSHLSRRKNIYTIPIGINKADVILFLLNDSFAQPSLKAQKATATAMERNRNYIQVYKSGDFIAFEKRNLYTKPKPKKGQVKLFPYSITALSDREYVPQDIKIENTVEVNSNFKSYIISYTSDGLNLYSLMNVPNSPKPANGYPVLVIDHGYINPTQYNTVSSYKSIADYFSTKGFMVLKPDYRGNGNSEVEDKSLMRFAYPIDVLNLLSSIKNIPGANSNKIFLWSHSMGGEVTLEVLEVASKKQNLSSSIKAAVFWAPVTDPVKWFSKQNLNKLPEASLTPYPYTSTFKAIGTPEQNPKLWDSLSPLKYLQNIKVPVLLQHGTGDTTVPYSWSVKLYSLLKSLNKNVQFLSYPGDSHNLPKFWSQAANSDYDFFARYLNK